MRVLRLFKTSFAPARSPLSAPRATIRPAGVDDDAALRAAWPKAPVPQVGLSRPAAVELKRATAFLTARPRGPITPRSSRTSGAPALDLTFAHSPARARRIARGLEQAGIVAHRGKQLIALPTYSVLQGKVSRTQALGGKHMLSQKEWAAVWVALSVQHHGLQAAPKRITRMPMSMRYDFFVVVGVTERPEESRRWVHTLRDAGVLSRRLHPKSYAAMADAANALNLPLDGKLMAQIEDSLFLLPKYVLAP